MQEWTEICFWDEVPDAGCGGKYVVIGKHILAVWRMADESVRVMDDRCPHAGGSLSAGHYDDELDCVMCPWHAWPFDPNTGACPDNPIYVVRTYEAKVEGGRVWAKLNVDA